jgi:hypothetical protein
MDLMGYVLLQVVNMNLSIDITNNYFSVNIICDLLCMAEVMFRVKRGMWALNYSYVL